MEAAPTWTNITVRLGDLKPWAHNPRQSTKKQAEKLLQSWREFGQVETIAVSPDLDLYNGHQRLSALLTVYGREYVIEARQSSRHLTEEEKRKLTITLHAGAVGSWDWDSLSSWQPAELTEWGFDDSLLTNWRLDVASLGNLLESEAAEEGRDAPPQIDRAAELQKEWGTAVGQLWRMESRTPGNEHRLICGDCTDAGVVDRVMMGERADCVIADAPYGMFLDTNYANRLPGERATAKNYDAVIGDNEDFDPRPIMALFSCKEQFWFGADYYAERIPDKNKGSWFVWDKRKGMEDSRFSLSEFETIWSKSKHGRRVLRHRWMGVHGMETQDTTTRVHPTQKPVELIQEIILEATGSAVADPFLGSGSTLIAAENLSRQCRAIEIAPGYVAVALQRYQDAFGITAELIETI